MVHVPSRRILLLKNQLVFIPMRLVPLPGAKLKNL